MKLRLTRNWRQWREGEEIELSPGPAMVLIERQTAVRVEEGRRTASVAHEEGRKTLAEPQSRRGKKE